MSLKERYYDAYKKRINQCIQFKIEDEHISIKELSKKLGVSTSMARLAFKAANAWVHRKKVDTLIEQLNTGNLDGLEPIGSLDHQ